MNVESVCLRVVVTRVDVVIEETQEVARIAEVEPIVAVAATIAHVYAREIAASSTKKTHRRARRCRKTISGTIICDWGIAPDWTRRLG